MFFAMRVSSSGCASKLLGPLKSFLLTLMNKIESFYSVLNSI
jgi:hypothetical protein